MTMISEPEGLADLCTAMLPQTVVGLDTEFLRERTYYAQLCLLQVAWPAYSACIDTLALPDLAALKPCMASPALCKVLHAARQDLEVLGPAAGNIVNVFDTQIAAALIGLPAQIGYADLVKRLLNVVLGKAHTRTDWSRRPLSSEQVEYALDDVRYLLPLHEQLRARLQQLGRSAWFDEEMAEFGNAESFVVDPEQSWKRLKGLSDLDPARIELARAVAAWRERRAMSSDRPRSWILPDAALRELVLRVPRSMPELTAISELPERIRHNSGAQLLAVIEAVGLPAQLPELPQRRRPDPEQIEVVRRLVELTQLAGRELGLAPEILATRRELEMLAGGTRDVAPLTGWRGAVIGERLLQAL